MDIAAHRQAGVVVLELSGRLDATTAKTCEDRILAGIESGDRRLVIDLSRMEYVSSAGLRVFLVAARRLGTEGKLVLCCPTGHVRRVLDLVGFSSILGIYGSRDEAIDRV